MLNKEVIRNWSSAIFQIAIEEKKVPTYLKQVTILLDVLRENKQVLTLLSKYKLKQEDINKFIDKTFVACQFDQDLINAIYYMIDSDVFWGARAIFNKTQKLLLNYEDGLNGIIYSPVKLDSKTIKSIEDKFSKKYKKDVSLAVEVDKKLIAGIKVVIGNQIFDGSVKQKLNDLRTKIKQIEHQGS